MARRNLLCSRSLVMVLAGCPSVNIADQLRINGIVGGDKVVVMGDARRVGATGCINDQVLRSTGATNLPNLTTPQSCNSEITILGANNAMLLETPVTTWTNSNADIHTVTLEPVIHVPVVVWIANSSAGAQAKAEKHVKRANELYLKNKVGVRFVATYTEVSRPADVSVINNGIGPDASGADFECKDIAALRQNANLYRPNTLNVYYVASLLTGRNCALKKTPPDCQNLAPDPDGDGNITYIGTKANRASLAHEFGHAFGLRPGPCGGHTNGLPGFAADNIMWAGGDGNRSRFTLGQVFRMNTQRDLWGGTMLIKNGLRSGPERQCPPLIRDALCPALGRDWNRP